MILLKQDTPSETFVLRLKGKKNIHTGSGIRVEDNDKSPWWI